MTTEKNWGGEWYAVVVLCVGVAWRIAVAWSQRTSVVWGMITLFVGVWPYVALAKVSGTVRSVPILVTGAVLVLVEDIRVWTVVEKSHGPLDGVALLAYPFTITMVIVGIDLFVSAVNKRPRK